MTTYAINNTGEQIVVSLLKANGYFNIFKNPNYAAIEADGGMRRILFKVKTALLSDAQPVFTAQEIHDIKLKASQAFREPWGAVLRIDNRGNLVGNILWYDFSKIL